MPRALVIGAGGLGCPALLALAPEMALTIVDHDRVDITNLQRQILHRMADVGTPKVVSAAAALHRRWPEVRIEPIEARLDSTNAAALISGHDVVIDGTDSFETKFLVNDVCLAEGVPLVHGGVVGWTGQAMTVAPGHVCFRCIFEEPPPAGAAPTCQDAGILGALCGVIGGLMAEEALAVLKGRPQLMGALRIYEALPDRWRTLRPRPRPGCPAHRASEVATW